MPKNDGGHGGPNVWVVRAGRGFAVKEERKAAPLSPVTTQPHAIAHARGVAKQNRSELIVQGRTGRIRIKNSYGADPNPPRG